MYLKTHQPLCRLSKSRSPPRWWRLNSGKRGKYCQFKKKQKRKDRCSPIDCLGSNSSIIIIPLPSINRIYLFSSIVVVEMEKTTKPAELSSSLSFTSLSFSSFPSLTHLGPIQSKNFFSALKHCDKQEKGTKLATQTQKN